jgi:hypothetical protein
VAQALGDTEKIVIKHYTRFIPELGEQLRSFVENGRGLDEQPSEVFLEGIAQHGQRSGSCEPPESLKPESAYTSDIAECRATKSDAVAAPQTAQPGEYPAVAIVCQARTEDGKILPGHNADSDAKRGSVAAKPDRGAVVHGTRTAYDRYGCRCELCKAASSEHMKNYRARLKAEGREPMTTLICAECGKEFLRLKRNSPAARGTINAFCTKACFRQAAVKRGGVVVHGTRTAYDKYGCRCGPCRAAHSEHMKKCRAGSAKRKSQEPTQGTNYDQQVPCQGIEREVINKQNCA